METKESYWNKMKFFKVLDNYKLYGSIKIHQKKVMAHAAWFKSNFPMKSLTKSHDTKTIKIKKLYWYPQQGIA